MAILLWVTVGSIAGWVASLFSSRQDQGSILLNLVAGIAGAAIGGLIYAGGTIDRTLLDLSSFMVSLAGAAILLGGVQLLSSDRLH